ncbi:UNVERIFIED_CONTAM: hypothetical protein PYX00_000708 [Menopon gallinae]|uniref:Gag protein n=1 Tax=Menopon gallinae TaxID=328185 RepID=A0AAW2IAC8_9NEOP
MATEVPPWQISLLSQQLPMHGSALPDYFRTPRDSLVPSWIATKNYLKLIVEDGTSGDRCRRCFQVPETIQHVIGSCLKLPQTDYKHRYDQVAKVIHQKLALKYDFPSEQKPYHKPSTTASNPSDSPTDIPAAAESRSNQYVPHSEEVPEPLGLQRLNYPPRNFDPQGLEFHPRERTSPLSSKADALKGKSGKFQRNRYQSPAQSAVLNQFFAIIQIFDLEKDQ